MATDTFEPFGITGTKETLLGLNPDAVVLPDLDDAIVGFTERYGMPDVLVYSIEAVYEIAIDRHCDPYEFCEQMIHWNTSENAPIFMHPVIHA